MRKFVKLEINMEDGNYFNDDIVSYIQDEMCVDEVAEVQDEPETSYFVCYFTQLTVDEIVRRVQNMMAQGFGIYNAIITYIYDGEFSSDRIALWADGERIDYRGRVEYIEEAK